MIKQRRVSVTSPQPYADLGIVVRVEGECQYYLNVPSLICCLIVSFAPVEPPVLPESTGLQNWCDQSLVVSVENSDMVISVD